MFKTLRKVSLLFLLTLSVVCGALFIAACDSTSTPDGDVDTRVTYSVTVILDAEVEEDITLTSLKAQWLSGTTPASEEIPLNSDGYASVKLEAGSYTVTLKGLPATATYEPASATVANLNVTINVTAVPAIPQLAAPTGLDIQDDILTWNPVDDASGYIVYNGNTPIEENIASNTTSYDLKLANLGIGTYTIYVAAKGDNTNHRTSEKSAPIPYEVEPASYNLTLGEPKEINIGASAATATTLNIAGVDASGWTDYIFTVEAKEGLQIYIVINQVAYLLTYEDGAYTRTAAIIGTAVKIYASEEITATVTVSEVEEEEDYTLELDVEKSITLATKSSNEAYTFTAAQAGVYKIALIDVTIGDVWVNYSGTPLLNDEIESLEAEFTVKTAETAVDLDFYCNKTGGITFKVKITLVKATGGEVEDGIISVNVPGTYGTPVEVTLDDLVSGKAYSLSLKECDIRPNRDFVIYITYNNVQYSIDTASRVVSFVATSTNTIVFSSSALYGDNRAAAKFELGDALGVNGDSYTPEIKDNSDLIIYVAGIHAGKEYTVTTPANKAMNAATVNLIYNGNTEKFTLNGSNYEAKFTAANDDLSMLINYITISCGSFSSNWNGMFTVSLVGEEEGEAFTTKTFEITLTSDSPEFVIDLAQEGIPAGDFTVSISGATAAFTIRRNTNASSNIITGLGGRNPTSANITINDGDTKLIVTTSSGTVPAGTTYSVSITITLI